MLTVAKQNTDNSVSDFSLTLSFAVAESSQQISIACPVPETGMRYSVECTAHPAWAFAKQTETVLEKLALTIVSGMFCKELRMIRCKFKPFGSKKSGGVKLNALRCGTALRLRL